MRARTSASFWSWDKFRAWNVAVQVHAVVEEVQVPFGKHGSFGTSVSRQLRQCAFHGCRRISCLEDRHYRNEKEGVVDEAHAIFACPWWGHTSDRGQGRFGSGSGLGAFRLFLAGSVSASLLSVHACCSFDPTRRAGDGHRKAEAQGGFRLRRILSNVSVSGKILSKGLSMWTT